MQKNKLKSLKNEKGSYFKVQLKNTEYQFKKITYSENPVRTPVILLHDSFGCIELWRGFPEKLSSVIQRDVYIYDRQGYGKSDPFEENSRENTYMIHEAEVLIDLMNTLNIKTAVLFGHSDGATIALLAGAYFPDRIEAVISEAAHVFVEEITLNGIRQAVYAYENTGLKSRLEKYHGNKTELLFSLWHKTWLNEDFLSWNMFDQLSMIICPILIIQGEKDEFGSLKQVEHIEEKTKGYSERFILKDIGHSPHKDAPDRVIKKTEEFSKHYFNNL